MIDIDTILQSLGLGGGAAGGIAGWLSIQNNKKVEHLEEVLYQHRLDVAREHATKEELRSAMLDLKTVLIRIENKLDKKADK